VKIQNCLQKKVAMSLRQAIRRRSVIIKHLIIEIHCNLRERETRKRRKLEEH